MFAELSPTDQWLLHDFFKPSRERSDLALLAQPESAIALRPSLPHQAGRALSRFWVATARLGVQRVARAKAPASPGRVCQADRKLTVKALARPEVEVQKLVKPLRYLVEDIAKKKQADEERQDHSRP